MDTAWPTGTGAGRDGHWVFTDRRGRETRWTGTFLGMGTSFKTDHMHHDDKPFAGHGQGCSRCRWIEIRLFREQEAGGFARYLVVRRGVSVVPGETDRITCTEVDGPFQAVETVTSRPEDGTVPFMIRPAAFMLAQAAQHDTGIRDAYVNRAVA